METEIEGSVDPQGGPQHEVFSSVDYHAETSEQDLQNQGHQWAGVKGYGGCQEDSTAVFSRQMD